MKMTPSVAQFVSIAVLFLVSAPFNAVSASDVIELNADNFDATVIESSDVGDKWMVEFFAPWCGHCQRLAPIWEEVGTALKDEARVAKVDCPANKALCGRFGVRGYPTIKMVDSSTRLVYEYSGERNVDGFASFFRQRWKETTPSEFPSQAPKAVTAGDIAAAVAGAGTGAGAGGSLVSAVYMLLVGFVVLGVAYLVWDFFTDRPGASDKLV